MKRYYKLLILTLAAVSLNSCFKEYLDPVPKTAISDLTAFDTRDRILNQATAMYVPFKSGQYLGGRYQVYNDIRTDDFLNLQSNGVTGLQTWTLNVAPTTNEVQNLWEEVYAGINRINVFLEGLEANRSDIVPRLITQAEFDQLKGEALALRGMAYFHLSQLYARPYNQNPNNLGLVLRITAQRTSADNDMARSTVADTYAQIVKDLTDATSLLPLRYGDGTGNSVANVSRMQRGTVNALLSRVHLHMSNYPAALAAGNNIVSASAPFVNDKGGVQYGLTETFAQVFASPYTSQESIFSIPMTDAELPGTQNQLGHYFSGRAGAGGNNEYPVNTNSPVWTNLAEFPADDARRLLTETFTVQEVERIFLNKYPAFPHTDYAPVIRYAEVLLNVAEAEARVSGVNARAVALLNAVHQRSNPGVSYQVGDFASADAFVDRLMRERNIEFLGEGIRNMDIMRKVATIGQKGPVPAVPPTSSDYIWPIPQTEINTNSLIVQN
jgi:starch-binding outer membrane protein, SusD/RagB family